MFSDVAVDTRYREINDAVADDGVLQHTEPGGRMVRQ